jgi:Flp pilus assembly protein TadD
MSCDEFLRRSVVAAFGLAGMIMVASFSGFAQSAGDNKSASGASKETAELHLARGHDDLKTNHYEAAVREFRAALALDPRLTVRARFPLAVALFSVQDREQARNEFEAVHAEFGDDPIVMYYLGRLDLMDGRLDAAITKLTLAAADPPFPDAAYYLGYAYFKKRDLTSAEQWLRKAAELTPRDFRVQERLGLLFQASGRKEAAEKAFALSAELHQSDTQATQVALDCAQKLETQSLEEARGFCQHLFDPQDVGKLVTLGMLYGQHGDYADAVEAFRRATELEPDSYELQYDLGLTYFRLKRYNEARAPLEKAVELRADVFEVNAPLGAALFALGDDLHAYHVLSKAHQLNPDNADVKGLLFNVASLLAQQSLNNKIYADALRYLLRAAELRPDEANTHRRLADVYLGLGDKAKAEKERQKAHWLEYGP